MGPVGRARELLRQTEEKLRDLVSEAVNFADYPSVLTLAEWARTVSELTKPSSALGLSPTPVRPSKQNADSVTALERGRSAHSEQDRYPRFVRRSDQLVRIARSKRKKKEYRHKVPYSILKILANAMAEKGRDGRVFSTEEFLPVREGEDGGLVPNYQAYVGIALLKQTGLIEQHGREGYSIPRIGDFESAVEGIWAKLPEK